MPVHSGGTAYRTHAASRGIHGANEETRKAFLVLAVSSARPRRLGGAAPLAHGLQQLLTVEDDGEEVDLPLCPRLLLLKVHEDGELGPPQLRGGRARRVKGGGRQCRIPRQRAAWVTSYR